jgi:predicted nucleotidyltransferase
MTGIEADKLQSLPIALPMGAIAAFCERWNVREFALFGSVLREDFRSGESDVDVLVAFEDGSCPTLLEFIRMEQELTALFGRKVDLLERVGLEQNANPFIRIPVLESARVVYAR